MPASVSAWPLVYAPSLSPADRASSVFTTLVWNFPPKAVGCVAGGVWLKSFLSVPLLKTVLIAGRPIWSMRPLDPTVDAQTPRFVPGSASFGTWMTIAFVFSGAKKSVVLASQKVRDGSPMIVCLNASRSKKNGSERRPTNTSPPPLSAFVASVDPPARSLPWPSVCAFRPLYRVTVYVWCPALGASNRSSHTWSGTASPVASMLIRYDTSVA